MLGLPTTVHNPARRELPNTCTVQSIRSPLWPVNLFPSVSILSFPFTVRTYFRRGTGSESVVIQMLRYDKVGGTPSLCTILMIAQLQHKQIVPTLTTFS